MWTFGIVINLPGVVDFSWQSVIVRIGIVIFIAGMIIVQQIRDKHE